MGVFIQGISGKLYSEAEWNSQETPNGIAVITDSCMFVVRNHTPNEYISNNAGWCANNSVRIHDCMTADSEANAVLDFKGKSNTEAIIAQVGEGGLVSDCYNSIAPNGARGYMPAYGELCVYKNNLTMIENLLNLI